MSNPSDSIDYRDFLLKWFWHEGENLNQRTDWFLIFHGILVEAYLAVNSSSNSGITSRGLEIGGFGLVTSFLWLMVGIRNEWHIKYLVECVKRDDVIGSQVAHVLSALLDARKQQPRWIRWVHSVGAFAKVVPFSCLTMWLILVLQRWFLWCWVLAIVGPIFATGGLLIARRPKISSQLLEKIVPSN